MSNLTFAFLQQRGSLNPLNVVDVDNNSVPAFIDVDADGDLDAFIGNRDGVIFFYRNDGGNFTEQTGNLNPLNAVNVDTNPNDSLGGYSAPAFVDVEGDGDLDAVIGNRLGSLFYFRNNGGTFAQQSGTLNPFLGIDVGDNSLPFFADVDGDGDGDAVIGNRLGSLFYFRNDGGTFVQQSGTLNPFLGIDIGGYSAPAFVDIDGDGNVDVVIGNQAGSLFYFRNNGSTFVQQQGTLNPFLGIDFGSFSAPAFADLDEDGDVDGFVGSRGFGSVDFLNRLRLANYVERTGTSNPLNANFPANTAPAFADLDNDGDLDVAIGNQAGSLFYFQNNGGTFVQQSGTSNPFLGIDVGINSVPAFADLDADGDLDVAIGNQAGSLFYFQNNGGTFVQQRGTFNPFLGFDVGTNSSPAFLDVDADGDEDVFVGAANGTVSYFRNDGGSFTLQAAENPLAGVNVGFGSSPSFADADGDGDLDAYVGNSAGNTFLYRNNQGTFAFQPGTLNPLATVNVGNASSPGFVDIDTDGDADAFIGAADGTINFLEDTPLVLAARTGAANPFNGVDVLSSPVPTFADLDRDGDLDLFLGEINGTILFFRNTNGTFSPVAGNGNPFNGIDVGFVSTPTFVDIDTDGDLDLFSGEFAGTINFYRNDNGQFVEQVGTNNPFNGVDVGSYSNIAFANIDGDGDEDAFLGLADGTIRYLRNENGSFVQRGGTLNPLNGVDAGFFSFPSFADADGDGDADALIGEAFGETRFYRNDGGTFTEVTGSSNPFDTIDVGFYAAPSFADVDGDGDLDTAVGGDFTILGTNNRGRLNFFENVAGDLSGSGTSAALTIASSLLADEDDVLLVGGTVAPDAAFPDLGDPAASAAPTNYADLSLEAPPAELQAMMEENLTVI
ncbi:MAG: FG-GAP-like repeat-containing protein [Cyanophyceae cyanobacterium]